MDFLMEILFFLALVNPVSKVMVLSFSAREAPEKDLKRVAFVSTLAALVLLILFAGAGSALMTRIFHVEVYALKVAGGVVLFVIGLRALTYGRFFELDERTRLADLSLVPLGAPMIAGPGTITAAVSETVRWGFAFVTGALAVALVINFLIMLESVRLARFLDRFHLMGPLIRISGFIVAGMAVQMGLTGLSEWMAASQMR